MRRRMFKLLLLGLVALYALVTLAVWLAQDRLVFPGARRGRGAALFVPPGVNVATRTLANGARIRTATALPTGTPTALVLLFLGNGEDLRSGVAWADLFARLGAGVVVQEYPGYGESDGEPSVASFLSAAEAAVPLAKELAARHGVPVVAAGSSLGSFSAVHLAARGDVDRLLLLAPPGSLLEVAKQRYWYLPVGWLLRHRFDAYADAARVACKSLVVHGDLDVVAPLASGRRLASALRGELIVAAGLGHNDLYTAIAGPLRERIQGFLAGR